MKSSKDKAEELFAERCTALGDGTGVNYQGVNYAIVGDSQRSENFVIVSCEDNPYDYAYSLLIFPTRRSRDQWYTSVEECTEKLKSWIHVSVENKVKHVNKEIPILTDNVYAFVNCITRGRGQDDLLRKAIREHYTGMNQGLVSGGGVPKIVKFIGDVEADDDTFKHYSISIWMICGESFNSQIFHAYGTIEKIGNEIIEFLTFVNPKTLENARKTQAKKEDLFR